MNDPLQDERISAYLDGELTDEERTAFEIELTTDPDRRQLLDELRSLSTALGGLEQHSLGNQFHQQVLRQAERAVLTQSAGDETPDITSQAERSPVTIRSETPLGYSRRGWAWASMAVAAALLLMIVQHEFDEPEYQVAKLEPARPVIGDATIGALEDSADESGAEINDAESRMARDDAADAPAPAAIASKGGEASTDALRSNEAAKSVPSSDLAEMENAAPNESPAFAGKGGINSSLARRSKTDSGQTLNLRAKRETGDKGGPRLADSDGNTPTATSQVMVVHLDIRADAADRSRLNVLLAANGIACDTNSQYGLPIDAKADSLEDQTGKRSPIAKNRASNVERRRAAGFQGRGIGGGGGRGSAEGRQASEDVVFVEASYAQVAKTLEQLHADPKNFPAIEIDAAPDVRAQQTLVQNSRGQTTNYWTSGDQALGDADAKQRQGALIDKMFRAESTSAPAKDVSKDSAQVVKEAVAGEEGEATHLPTAPGSGSDIAATEATSERADRQLEALDSLSQSDTAERDEAERTLGEVGQQQASVAGEPLDEQLQVVFDDSLSSGSDRAATARAARVPLQQRSVAEQIVVSNRSFNLKQNAAWAAGNSRNQGVRQQKSPQTGGLGRSQQPSQRANPLRRSQRQTGGAAREDVKQKQQAAAVDSRYRDSDRLQVLFVLNIVDRLEAKTAAEPADAETDEP